MKGYIYKIYDNTNYNVYYGSTKQLVCKRIAEHRADYKKFLNKKKNYCKSYDILKNGDYSYCVVEEVEYENKWELLNRERYYIENNECINKIIPYKSNEEQKETMKLYYNNNKEYINNKKKINYENKKEHYLKYAENYRLEHKEKILCECGSNVLKLNIVNHKKTKKHITYINNLTQ